jgi:threonine-phosphate decarboxylase
MCGPLQRSAVVPLVAHGGDVAGIAREYDVSVDHLVDFSANINPLGPPERALKRLAREVADRRVLARYPDPGYVELRKALSDALHIPAAAVTIANGSVALIGAVIRASAPRVCLLVTPAFGEYSRALRANGCRVRSFPLDPARGFRLDTDELISVLTRHRPSLCMLTNPHNPSGALTPRTETARVVEAARRTNTRLVLDEAFMDYAPGETLLQDAVRTPHLVVLRSTTKFYGMPALRVGYAVSSPPLASRLATQLPPWPVTSLAASAAAEAILDQRYVRRTLTSVTAQRRWLSLALARLGMTVYPSAANFLLLRLPSSSGTSTRVRARLIEDAGVVVRDCRSFEGLANGRFIRVAVRTRQENERLVRALESLLEGRRDVR